jgi:hypothetical protein
MERWGKSFTWVRVSAVRVAHEEWDNSPDVVRWIGAVAPVSSFRSDAAPLRAFAIGQSPLSFQKAGNSAWPIQVVDHLVPNRILTLLIQGERERGKFLFSKACKNLYRRRFIEFEDAPCVAYCRRLICEENLKTVFMRLSSESWSLLP